MAGNKKGIKPYHLVDNLNKLKNKIKMLITPLIKIFDFIFFIIFGTDCNCFFDFLDFDRIDTLLDLGCTDSVGRLNLGCTDHIDWGYTDHFDLDFVHTDFVRTDMNYFDRIGFAHIDFQNLVIEQCLGYPKYF